MFALSPHSPLVFIFREELVVNLFEKFGNKGRENMNENEQAAGLLEWIKQAYFFKHFNGNLVNIGMLRLKAKKLDFF